MVKLHGSSPAQVAADFMVPETSARASVHAAVQWLAAGRCSLFTGDAYAVKVAMESRKRRAAVAKPRVASTQHHGLQYAVGSLKLLFQSWLRELRQTHTVKVAMESRKRRAAVAKSRVASTKSASSTLRRFLRSQSAPLLGEA